MIQMKKLLTIRPLEDSEIGIAGNLIPSDWDFDLQKFQHTHPEKESYRAFGGFLDGKLVSFGDVIINGSSGWLGNIVVSREFRTRGYGQALAIFLVNFLKNKDCSTILTMTSDSNKSNFQKLGFLTSSMYCVLSGTALHTPKENRRIRPVESSDHSQILDLDFEATNEDRRVFLNGSINNGWVYDSAEKGKILGYFLPGSGEGPVIALDEDAGIGLLQLKHSLFLKDAIIPCENKLAVDFLKINHFREREMIHRMFIGEDLDVRQDMIFSRAGRFGT
jgi:hypothetical protein